MKTTLVLLGTLLLLQGCTDTLENPNGNFVLHVSNQSFAIDPIDIRVAINGNEVIDQDFLVGSQHNWQTFRYELQVGTHRIQAVTTAGEAALDETFNIVDQHWAVLDYWYYPDDANTPKQFSFLVQDSPIGFD